MADELAGFPWWEVAFDQAGNRTDPVADPAAIGGLATGLDLTGVTDLLVMCHGWKNDRTSGRAAYEQFFTQLRGVLDDHPPRSGVSLGAMGIYWPSLLWADDRAAAGPGPAAGAGPATEGDLVGELKQVYPAERQQAALDELGSLLDRQPDEQSALDRFQVLLRELVPTPAGGNGASSGLGEPGDEALNLLVDGKPEEVFGVLSADSEIRAPQGAVDLGSPFRALWAGAKEALRQATYWEMKNRAGTVGQRGIGPLVRALHGALPELRVHLCGHSFGARAVSFALAGLPAPGTDGATPSPVKSLTLIQGAFSHYTFATSLPFDRSRGGALAGMAARVDGPLLVTHSLADLAVGRMYPLASLVARQDAAAVDDLAERWWAMGHRGAHGVPAAEATLGAAGTAYAFTPGGFLNLDANGVIRAGGPPSGAHGDIFHPQVAWALLAGAATVEAEPEPEAEGDLVGT
ncbi:MAG TPA: serine/threonine protein kinase [Actinomycetota bacterium]